MDRAKRRATYDDLMQVPDHLVAEIIDGELITSPRPASPHARASSVIGGDLGPFDGRPVPPGRPGGWWILDEPELHLGGSVLVPDLAGWRRERMPVIPKDHVFAIPPDWVCEVLSPSTRQFDVRRKLPVYAAHEVTNAWLVDPEARTLEVFRLENSRWSMVAVLGGNEIARAEPFDAIDIDLPSIWGAEPEPDSVNDR